MNWYRLPEDIAKWKTAKYKRAHIVCCHLLFKKERKNKKHMYVSYLYKTMRLALTKGKGGNLERIQKRTTLLVHITV